MKRAWIGFLILATSLPAFSAFNPQLAGQITIFGKSQPFKGSLSSLRSIADLESFEADLSFDHEVFFGELPTIAHQIWEEFFGPLEIPPGYGNRLIAGYMPRKNSKDPTDYQILYRTASSFYYPGWFSYELKLRYPSPKRKAILHIRASEE